MTKRYPTRIKTKKQKSVAVAQGRYQPPTDAVCMLYGNKFTNRERGVDNFNIFISHIQISGTAGFYHLRVQYFIVVPIGWRVTDIEY
ncbi:MAG: hypothetical protein J0L99_06240 [Chitinophagales bacterium]|nr:hypothetical protein [Chitinophagales bacterium]